jgi:hypothetical protein
VSANGQKMHAIFKNDKKATAPPWREQTKNEDDGEESDPEP